MSIPFPRTDASFLAWSLNFKTLITASPTTYGLTSAQATAYGVVDTTFATALAACDPNIRNKTSTATKNAARAALKLTAEQLASFIIGTPTVTDAQRIELGIPPRATPKPWPVPSSWPAVEVKSVNGWTVKVTLHDTASSAKRGKPPGVTGAAVFSFVGPEAPASIAQWKFEGNCGRSVIDIVFDSSLVAGTKVWLTAFWFNGRKQSGPACPPTTTNLQGGSVSMAA